MGTAARKPETTGLRREPVATRRCGAEEGHNLGGKAPF